MEDLPSTFDVIILGTGLGCSLLAGALGRIGKSVLQADRNDYYGGAYASFTAREIKRKTLKGVTIEGELTKDENRVTVNLDNNILYSRGEMIQLLIQSKAYRYVEFANVQQMLTQSTDKLIPVPSSRAELFCSKHVSLLEKRKMMNFINAVSELGSDGEIGDCDTFDALMAKFKLSEKLKRFIANALCFANSTTVSAKYGLDQLKRFIGSMGKYAATSSFLVPQYGTGELCQAFCRMAAVFGGTVMLDAKVERVRMANDNNDINEVTIEGKRITTHHLVAEADYVVEDEGEVEFYTATIITTEENWRSMIDTDAKLEIIGDMEEEQGKTQIHNFVISSIGATVWGCATDYTAHCVTKGNVMIMLRSREKNELNAFIEKLNFESNAFKVTSQVVKHDTSALTTVHVAPTPQFLPDYDYAVVWARQTFAKICPDEEWLPAMPDPSDIIIPGATE